MLPDKCKQCAKFKRKKVRTECRICAETDFERTVLCELHRSVEQDTEGFECHAFTPLLSVAGSNDVDSSQEHARGLRENPLAMQLAISKLMNSDRIKYQTALALQKLTENPEAIIIELKFHFVWSVQGRQPIFSDLDQYSAIISEILSAAAIPSVRRADLLWIAPDHVHVYCDSDGEKSVEDTVQELKHTLERGIVERCPELPQKLMGEEQIWEDSYFAETLDSF